MRNLNDTSGAAANETASAPSTEKLKSGMGHLFNRHGSFLHLRKKAVDRFPNLGAAGESLPFSANQTNEPVALIDRNDEILRHFLYSIDEQGFGIGSHLLQHRIAFDNLSPGFEVE